METVRIGIIGMGIGRANGSGFARSPRCTISALCDLAPERMQMFARDLPGPVAMFTDYRELCASSDVDAIFVGTPNQLHVPVALEAVRNDKHVMVTKPLADSLGPARELVAATEAAGVVGMMSLSIRFGAEVQYLGRQVRAGSFGPVYYARSRSVRRSGIPSWSAGFVQRGGGAWRDMGVHMLDAAWWIMGMPRPVSVTGVAGARFGPRGAGFWDYRAQPALAAQFAADDYAGGTIRFADGSGLQVESFWASHQPDELQIELFGEEAGAKLDPLTIYRTLDGAPADTTVTLPTGPDAWEVMADHFAACILDGVPCEAPLRHGLIVQELLEAMLASAETGREVEVGGSS
jgi:predicted dehydrogenase